MDWTLAELRTNGYNGIRELTGNKSTSNPTNAVLLLAINEFYQNRFVHEVKPAKLEGTFSQATSATDSGQYTVSTDNVLLEEPVTVNGSKVRLYQNRADFFDDYPDVRLSQSAYPMTDPTLVIGTSSTAAVRWSAFTFWIDPYSYSETAGETALSGDTVPQNKYGAWRLEIEGDGTVSIVAASNNATGYDTAAQAIAGLAVEQADAACMGFVTAVSTDSGGFVPGTTSLSDGAVTATYTDGFHTPRGRPQAVLYDRHILYARPIPNDVFVIETVKFAKPTALSSDSDRLPVPEWGPVVAHGTAIEILLGGDDTARVAGLSSAYDYYRNLIRRKKHIQTESNQRTKPTF